MDQRISLPSRQLVYANGPNTCLLLTKSEYTPNLMLFDYAKNCMTELPIPFGNRSRRVESILWADEQSAVLYITGHDECFAKCLLVPPYTVQYLVTPAQETETEITVLGYKYGPDGLTVIWFNEDEPEFPDDYEPTDEEIGPRLRVFTLHDNGSRTWLKTPSFCEIDRASVVHHSLYVHISEYAPHTLRLYDLVNNKDILRDVPCDSIVDLETNQETGDTLLVYLNRENGLLTCSNCTQQRIMWTLPGVEKSLIRSFSPGAKYYVCGSSHEKSTLSVIDALTGETVSRTFNCGISAFSVTPDNQKLIALFWKSETLGFISSILE